MNRNLSIALIALLLKFSVASGAADEAAVPATTARYLQVSVDRVVIDTQGLASASTTLAGSVDQLALAIGRLASADAELSAADRALVTSAVQSVDAAAAALRQLAEEIPRTARELDDRLPRMIADAGRPIAELSRGLQATGDSLLLINESLPQATENAKTLVNATLDAALLRLSTYTLVLFAALALAVIAVIWFIYRQYLGPLVRKLDQLTGAPEYLEAMASHMKDTSANLLQLEREAAGGGNSPSAD